MLIHPSPSGSMRYLITLLAALTGSLVGSVTVSAQQLVVAGATRPVGTEFRPTLLSAADSTRCSYIECALRVEPSFRGPRLVRGLAGSPVARLDQRDLLHVFAGNDSALAYAAQYQRAERTDQLLTIPGIVLGLVGLSGPKPDYAMAAVGGGLVIASFPYQSRAQRSLSRAVWWYNAALPPVAPSRD